jgi:hypothetical protein
VATASRVYRRAGSARLETPLVVPGVHMAQSVGLQRGQHRPISARFDSGIAPLAHFPTIPLDSSGHVDDTEDMRKHTTISKKDIDSKGRVTLGASFANRTVIVEERDGEIVLKLARLIPERESWLYDNHRALASVRRGLNQAKSGTFAKKGPDLKAAAELAESFQDD